MAEVYFPLISCYDLLYNVQCWHTCTKSMRIINNVYMRALRRIGGFMRYGASDTLSDIEVRTHLCKPSIDCLLMRKRLLYIPRILISKCSTLNALLSQRKKKPFAEVDLSGS